MMVLTIAALVALALILTLPAHTTAAQPGLGTQLQYCLTSTGTFITIGLRVSIEGPSPSQEEIDKTHLDSTLFEKRPGGLPNFENLKLKIWHDPADADHELIESWVTTVPPVVFFQLNLQDTALTSYAFEGWAKSFAKTGMDKDSNLTGDIEVVVTTVPVVTHNNPGS
jgi:hypothetical protein